MPIKRKFKQLSEVEKAIGKRVAECRRFRSWNQYQLAGEIGISRDRLASVENGRVALSTETAFKIAEVLRVNLMWLAVGWGDQKRFIRAPVKLITRAFKDRVFKQAYDSTLREFFENDWREVVKRHAEGKYTKEEMRIEIPSAGAAQRPRLSVQEFAEVELRELEGFNLDSLPETDKKMIQDQILLCKSVLGSGSLLPAPGAKSYSSLSNSFLTEASTSEKLGGVKAQLPTLLERLNLATKESGNMSALAKFLGVPLASVSRWLSGKREPGGEITLKLLQWVEQQERQK
jgi:transcriptional regulator with XRE-family HTH domain